MKILSVAQMRLLERMSNDDGNTYTMMMEKAGSGVAAIVKSKISPPAQILVLVGPGNNGGDGLVAARILHKQGYFVTAYLYRQRNPNIDYEFAQAQIAGVSLVLAEHDKDSKSLIDAVKSADVIIDALLGTGSSPPIHGTLANILRTVHTENENPTKPESISLARVPQHTAKHPITIAVDGPSGLDFDTGAVDDLTLPADISVTFASPKWGHLLRPGANFTGELVVVGIGTQEYPAVDSKYSIATSEMIQSWLPSRPADAHKGTFGRSMIVAGSTNYTGAAILASKGAVRAGAGLVTLAIPANLHSAIVSAIPEATYLLLPHTMGIINEQAVPILKEGLKGYNALLVGPGLGNTTESLNFLQALLLPIEKKRRTGFVSQQITVETETEKLPPLIIDADGLNILAQITNWHLYLPDNTILTPHPGEMSRLTGISTAEINTDRYKLAVHWAQTWHHIVLLKGANTVIASPDGDAIVLPFSNPGLGTAGTGDVLAGAISAMLAQGLSPFRAAVTGAYIHGLAGELCRQEIGTAGMIAGDVARSVAEALHSLE